MRYSVVLALCALSYVAGCKTEGDSSIESTVTGDSEQTCINIGDPCDPYSDVCCAPATCSLYYQCEP